MVVKERKPLKETVWYKEKKSVLQRIMVSSYYLVNFVSYCTCMNLVRQDLSITLCELVQITSIRILVKNVISQAIASEFKVRIVFHFNTLVSDS